MHVMLNRGLRPGIVRHHGNTGVGHGRQRTLCRKRPAVVQAFSEASTVPASRAAADAELSPQHRQLLQQHKGPLVKIATHYHVQFGDCLRVIGSSEELGAWSAADAPLMAWGEGDVWSLVLPLPPGEHEFKVVVQQANGNLIWESGDHNRVVSVPEDAPVDSMLVSVCAFNIIDDSITPQLQPITAEVMELLEEQLAGEAAAEEAKAAAEAEQAAAAAEQARAGQAAAAVAKALATMDAEAEGSGLRSRGVSDSDTDDEEQPAQPSRGLSGPAVVAASAAVADTPVKLPQQQKDAHDLNLAAAAEQLERSLDASSPSSPSAAAAGSASEEAQEVLAAAAAAEEMEMNLEAMSQEVHPSDVLAPDSHAQQPSPAAAVHAKLARDKPVAVGFMDKPAPPEATSSVVAAFIKSVGSQGPAAAPPAASDIAAETAAATAQDATATPSDSEVETAVSEARSEAAAAAEAPMEAEHMQQQSTAEAPAKAAPAAAEPVTETVEAVAAAAPAAAAAAAAAAKALGPLPQGWGPNVGASRFPAQATAGSSGSSSNSSPSSSYSSGMTLGGSVSPAKSATPPNSPSRYNRPPSPGRGSSHVVSAAAAAAVAAEWIAGVRSNNVMAAAREAEKAAEELAARLQQAQRKKSEAAAEAEMLHESLKHSSMVRGVLTPGYGNSGGGGGGGGGVVAAMAPPGPRGLMAAASSKVRDMTDAMAASSSPLSPPPITPAGASAMSGASGVLSAAAAAGLGPSPPPVMHAPGSTQRSVSTQAVSVNGGGSGGAGALTAAGAFNAASADAEVLEGAEQPEDGGWSEGMQFLAAIVGCAAVGTVLWSEFVLKETGCGLPPGPYGLLGAAEGLSYLAVLGFAGAGVGARVNSGGRQGLQGALAVPETLAYGALAAGLMVLASQLYEYGYIPPPLPGGQCFADSAVALPPGAEELNNQLAAQMAALQGILAQLQSAATDGFNQLQLQEQLAILQSQVDAFSGYVSTQAAVLDTQLQAGLLQLQDSLSTATSAVSSFVDTQLQQLDLSGKLAYVLDILRVQEQQLKVELPKQLAELQQLAATSMAVVQETALQASSTAHLPELLTSLDQVMDMLHGVLENRISQLDVVLTQLQSSIGAAAAQLSAAVAAAEQSGSSEAATHLQGLQALLAEAMSDVQAQVWAGYEQLALADKLSDMLLTVRSSAAAVAASTAAEVDKLRLQEQLQELEGLAEASAAALASNAMDGLQQLHLDERLNDIATQASAAAASLQAGLQQQYEQQLPAVEAQMSALQASLADLAARTEQQLGGQGPELETLLRQLQQSMGTTMKLVGEVAATGVTAAGDAVQTAGDAASTGLAAVNGQLDAATDAVSNSLASSFPDASITAGAGDAASSVAALDASAAADAASAAAALAADAGTEAAADASNMVANSMPDGLDILQLPDPEGYAAAETYKAGGLDLSEASDAIKDIWANRPQ